VPRASHCNVLGTLGSDATTLLVTRIPTLLAIATQRFAVQGRALTESIRIAFEHFTERAAMGFIVPEWLPTPSNLQYNGAVARLDSYVYGLIRQRRAELGLEGEVGAPVATSLPTSSGVCGRDAPVATSTRTDLLTVLVLSTDDDGSRMDDSHLRDELMTLLIAGQETSAILLAWLCAALAWHPQIQEKAAAEVQVGFGHLSPHGTFLIGL
jgi:cytochrome P450